MKFRLPVSLLAFFLATSQAFGEKGYVARRIDGCDWFLIESPQGYSLVEWYGGYDPDTGDPAVGNFHSYGMRTIYLGSSRRETRVWIDDYGLDEDEALSQLSDQCD